MYDKSKARHIMDKVKAAIEAALEGEDITVSKYRGSFDPRNLKLTIDLGSPDEAGISAKGYAFQQAAVEMGMKPEWLGRSFKSRGQNFTITGYNLKAFKFPVQAITDAGKAYKFDLAVVIANMKELDG